MNASRPTGTTYPVTQDELNQIGECLKKSLEQNPERIFTRGQHYLIDVYEGAEARKIWEGETLKDSLSDYSEHARIIYRMMSGVLQKQQKKLFPWTTFAFRPASVDGLSGQSSFLNLQVVRSVSRKLWAMIRVHYPSDSRRPPELCCYVDRHLPSLDVVVEPQIRIPLKANMKLAVDERSRVGLPAALFSDNTNLGKPLQASPQYVDVIENDGQAKIKLINASQEPVTVCEVVLLDFDEDDVDFDDGIELIGIEEGQVIKAGSSVEVTLKGPIDPLSQADSLLVGYARGTNEDLDEDEELMTEEELYVKLQGEDTRSIHVSLVQGQSYDLLKRALTSPESFVEELGEDLANDNFISGDEESAFSTDTNVSLILNSADLDGGSIGTLNLKIETQRDLEDFEPLACGDQKVEANLKSDHFTFGERQAVPSGLIEKKNRSKSKKAIPTQGVKLELVYLGKFALFNGLSTLDYGRARDFLLNCVGAASLLRALKVMQKEELSESKPLNNDLLL